MRPQPAIFEEHEIRRVYDEATETWWFSVVDIIRVLTQAADYQAARKYWKVLKGRLDKEASQLVTNCYQLKMIAEDALAELSTRQIAESEQATGMNENEEVARKGGGIAKRARVELEEKTGRRVVSKENFLPPSNRKRLAKK